MRYMAEPDTWLSVLSDCVRYATETKAETKNAPDEIHPAAMRNSFHSGNWRRKAAKNALQVEHQPTDLEWCDKLGLRL